MKSNYGILWILTGFFVVATGLYIGWSYVDNPEAWGGDGFGGTYPEGFWVGSITLLLTGILCALIAWYLQKGHRKQGGELPEDRYDADIDDGDPELGHFSPWSWWPIMLAGSASLFVVGLAVGVWLMFYAVPLLLISLVGWVNEYSRGNFGH
jgi:hypothetical protein